MAIEPIDKAPKTVPLDAPDPVGDDSETSEALDEMAMYCRDLYEEIENSTYRKNKLDQREDNRKKYRGERDSKTFPWPNCSNKSLMIDATVVDNLEPRLMSQLFGDQDAVNVEPIGEEDVEGAQKVKGFLSWALNSNMKWEEQLKGPIHDMLLDGTAVVIPLWEEEERVNLVRTAVPMFDTPAGPQAISPEQVQSPQVQQLIQMGALRFSGMEEKIEERPVTTWKIKLDQVPMNDCFFQDNGEDWEKQPFMRMIYPLYHELEALSEENGGPYKNLDRTLILGQTREALEHYDRDKEAKQIQHSEYSSECPLLECHIPWEDEWWLLTFSITAGWREVRRQPMREVYAHGRKAPVRFALYRETNESMGMGIPEKIKHFSNGVDDLYNQMIDNGTVENMPFGFIEEAPGNYGRDFSFKPGKLVRVAPRSNIQFPTFRTNSQKFMGFIEMLIQMLERLVSVMAFTASGQINVGSAGSDTYAGMSLLAHEANMKHQYTGRGLRARLSFLVRDVLSMYGQNLPYDAKMRIFENDQYTFMPFDLEAIQGQYDVEINVSSSSGNTMLKRQETTELFQMLGGSPIIDQTWLQTEILDSYDIKGGQQKIKPEINQLIEAFNADPGIMEAIQQYMMQKQQQAQVEQIQGQAQANVQRQQIEREVEMPVENQKIMDQVTERAKRKLVQPAVEDQIAAQAMQRMA